jgi:hypothetical protein
MKIFSTHPNKKTLNNFFFSIKPNPPFFTFLIFKLQTLKLSFFSLSLYGYQTFFSFPLFDELFVSGFTFVFRMTISWSFFVLSPAFLFGSISLTRKAKEFSFSMASSKPRLLFLKKPQFSAKKLMFFTGFWEKRVFCRPKLGQKVSL